MEFNKEIIEIEQKTICFHTIKSMRIARLGFRFTSFIGNFFL